MDAATDGTTAQEASPQNRFDVVIPLGNGSKNDNWELRMTLRALKRNFLDLGRVFICTTFLPNWITGIEHLDIPDKHRRCKDANIIDKMLAAVAAGCTDRFVRSSDDEMIISPIHVDGLKPYYALDLKDKVKDPDFWEGGWKWRLRLTGRLCQQRGCSTFHYDTHCPKLFDSATFQKIAANCKYDRGEGFTVDTLYFNQAGIFDPVKLSGQKLSLEKSSASWNAETIRKKIAGKVHLSYNDDGLTNALKQVLQEMFPEPSRFESSGMTFVPNMADTVQIPEVVAVVGAPRSGTSCTAGIIHHLGVSMGEKMRPPAPRNQRGFFEDIPLREICSDPNRRVKRFREWAIERGKHAGPIIGGKDGKMCNQIADLVKAWPKLKVVAVDRPIDEVVVSMQKAGTFKRMNAKQCEKMARNWSRNRDKALSELNVTTLRLAYHDVVSDPSGTIDKLIAFLGITPTPEQRAAALEFVTPDLYHNRVELTYEI